MGQFVAGMKEGPGSLPVESHNGTFRMGHQAR